VKVKSVSFGITLTFGISLNHCMTEFNHIRGLVISNVSAKDHVFVEIACVENTGRKSNFLDVIVDMIFSLKRINRKQPRIQVQRYLRIS
jgi:hypothetical protein